MQNKRRENTNTNLTKAVRTEQASFSKFLRVLGGATIVFFVVKVLKKLFAPYNPPIIIKSDSFVIGVSRPIGDLEEDDFTTTEDNDLLDPGHTYFRYKRTEQSVRCVVVFRDGAPIRCVTFDSPGARCIIKFYFGGCPDPDSRPDILVKGKFLRVRSRSVLAPESPGDPRYFFRSTAGQGLCAIIFRRVGNGVPEQQGEPVIFPDDDSVHLVLDSDPSRYSDLC